MSRKRSSVLRVDLILLSQCSVLNMLVVLLGRAKFTVRFIQFNSLPSNVYFGSAGDKPLFERASPMLDVMGKVCSSNFILRT